MNFTLIRHSYYRTRLQFNLIKRIFPDINIRTVSIGVIIRQCGNLAMAAWTSVSAKPLYDVISRAVMAQFKLVCCNITHAWIKLSSHMSHTIKYSKCFTDIIAYGWSKCQTRYCLYCAYGFLKWFLTIMNYELITHGHSLLYIVTYIQLFKIAGIN